MAKYTSPHLSLLMLYARHEITEDADAARLRAEQPTEVELLRAQVAALQKQIERLEAMLK
jgi:hypothetical protein